VRADRDDDRLRAIMPEQKLRIVEALKAGATLSR
jgi:hypothetical protein